MDLTEIKKDVENVRIFCSKYYPFLVIPLAYARIVVSENVPTCAVDSRGTIGFNPEWWSKLTISEKRFVLMHEILHFVLMHPQRSKGFNRILFNLAADAKVNEAINAPGIAYPSNAVTYYVINQLTDVSVSSLTNMSVEEITRLLEKNKCSYVVELDLCDMVDGEEVQSGEFVAVDPDDFDEEVKNILRRAEVFAKQAGNYPADLQKAVGEVVECKPPWPIILGLELRGSFKYDATFAYPSRRGDDYPGPISYNKSVTVLIDTSGSIDEETLKKFLGIVAYEARNATVNVIAWDAEAYEPIKARSPDEVTKIVAKKMKGGGGTVIAPALRKTLNTIEFGDVVIILTDGEIFDKDYREVSVLCKAVVRKASVAIVGYTSEVFSPPGFRSFMIW